ncbi:MAG: YkgJ family cysteine cluster protein [Nitrospinae bacterium]|nr:YkgJ family cysteine cluster protein [Nitrospinota bacterium]
MNENSLKRTGECHQCGECCKTVNMTVVRDVTLRQHGNREELELYLGYRGIRVVGEDVAGNALFYEVDIPCSQLTEDNGCKVHDSPAKPLLCLKYPDAPNAIEQCGYAFERQSPLEHLA